MPDARVLVRHRGHHHAAVHGQRRPPPPGRGPRQVPDQGGPLAGVECQRGLGDLGRLRELRRLDRGHHTSLIGRAITLRRSG
ncbi:hypothetical protein [Nonomuraea rubra]|uniref:hypothetical protein n=1 Tax=Nonomuraea rubra TaxID=46180 RepID=UPI0031EF9756